MDLNKRPDDMQRITTKELADKFIDEQVKLIQDNADNYVKLSKQYKED